MKKILFAAALIGAAMMTACGSKDGLIKGSLSKMDSLSYALGANIGYSMNYEMRDIPFNLEAVNQGVMETALGESKVDHEAAVEQLRNYFMTKRGERAMAIAAEYAKEDSIRMAGGDSTKIERPAANEKMFISEAERDSLSYALGNDIGYNLAESGFPVHVIWVGEAIKNVKEGQAKMAEDEVAQYLQNYFMVKLPAENDKASKEWLQKIEKKSGVKKTESGLLYKVVKEGDANLIAKDSRDEVKVHYTGKTRKGKVFDTSIFKNRSKEQQEMIKKQNPEGYDKDEPVGFPLNRVIAGWTEGLKLVGKGGKIMLWIPAELAYGSQSRSRDIGPNEALEFEVEVIDVIPFVEPAPVVAPADSTAVIPAK